MHRLKKKAEHDIINRDAAILYIDGDIYEDTTHAICLQRFITDNDYDMEDVDSFQYRPDIDKFVRLSKELGPVIVAHLSSKENGLFIDYGIIDGKAYEFNNVPKKYVKDLENYYRLKAYDDKTHDDSENPYDTDEQWEKAENRFEQLIINNQDYIKMLETLKQRGYEEKYGFLSNGYIHVEYYNSENGKNKVAVSAVGKNIEYKSFNKVIEYIDSCEMANYMQKLNMETEDGSFGETSFIYNDFVLASQDGKLECFNKPKNANIEFSDEENLNLDDIKKIESFKAEASNSKLKKIQ